MCDVCSTQNAHVSRAANSISLVNVDSTSQHGEHVFDVNCRICNTASTDNHLPSSSLAFARNSNDSVPAQDVGVSGHSPRKKICLAQRLKMYSAEQQPKSNTACATELSVPAASSAVSVSALESIGDVDELVMTVDDVKWKDSYESVTERMLTMSKANSSSAELHVPAVDKQRKDSLSEQKHMVKLKLEDRPAVLNDTAPEKNSNVAVEQTNDRASSQDTAAKNSNIAAQYVRVNT